MIKINRTTDGAEKIKGIGWRFARYVFYSNFNTVLPVTYQKQAKLGYTILPRESTCLLVHHNILIVVTTTIP